MPHFTQRGGGAGVDAYSSTDPTLATSPLLPLGTVVESRDGRAYRWCMVGSSTNLVAGNVIQSAAEITAHEAMTVSTVAIGATAITVTPSSTGGAANLYAEGYLAITVSTGLGYAYKVSSHLAITSSVAFVVNLDPADPIQIATVTATSKGDLIVNPYQNVIQAPITTLTGAIAGVAPYIITKAQNGWLQTWGPCAVLTKGTPGPGLAVGSPGSAAGAVVINTATLHTVGHMMETGVDAATNLVFLKIG